MAKYRTKETEGDITHSRYNKEKLLVLDVWHYRFSKDHMSWSDRCSVGLCHHNCKVQGASWVQCMCYHMKHEPFLHSLIKAGRSMDVAGHCWPCIMQQWRSLHACVKGEACGWRSAMFDETLLCTQEGKQGNRFKGLHIITILREPPCFFWCVFLHKHIAGMTHNLWP